MPPRTRKRKASEDGSDGDFDPNPSKKATIPAPKRAAPAKKREGRPAAKKATSDVLDSAADESSHEGEKNDDFMARIMVPKNLKLDDVKSDLRNEIEMICRAVDDGDQQMAQDPIIADITMVQELTEIIPYASKQDKRHPKRHTCAGEKADSILQDLRKNIEAYETLNHKKPFVNRPEPVLWDQDVQSLRGLNNKSFEIAKLEILRLVVSEKNKMLAAESDNSSMEKLAKEIWEENGSEQGQRTWAEMGQGIIGGATELLRVLTPRNMSPSGRAW